jgi:hypothetical protein
MSPLFRSGRIGGLRSRSALSSKCFKAHWTHEILFSSTSRFILFCPRLVFWLRGLRRRPRAANGRGLRARHGWNERRRLQFRRCACRRWRSCHRWRSSHQWRRSRGWCGHERWCPDQRRKGHGRHWPGRWRHHGRTDGIRRLAAGRRWSLRWSWHERWRAEQRRKRHRRRHEPVRRNRPQRRAGYDRGRPDERRANGNRWNRRFLERRNAVFRGHVERRQCHRRRWREELRASASR